MKQMWASLLFVMLCGCGRVEGATTPGVADKSRRDGGPSVDAGNGAGADGAKETRGTDGSTALSDAGAVSVGGQPGVAVELPPGVPRAIFEQPTVWIGEVERAVTYPPPEDAEAPQRVVLVLDALTDVVTGSVTFGSGARPPPPTDSTQPYPPEPWPAAATLSMYQPYDGFEYTLAPSELRGGDRLVLQFVPSELFGQWCGLQIRQTEVYQMCDCSEPAAGNAGITCAERFDPIRRLELVIDGETMAGELTRHGADVLGAPEAMRLRRVQ